MITIDARPESMTIDPPRTAVIVVDMQNDFGAEGGMFARAGIDISVNRGVIARTAKLLAAARKTGIKVVYLKMGFQRISPMRDCLTLRLGSNTCPSVSATR